MRRTEWLVEKTLWLLFVYISFVPYYYMQQQQLSGDVPTFSLVKYMPFVLSVTALGLWSLDVIMGKRRLVSSPLYVYIALFLAISLMSLWSSEYARVGLVKWIYYQATGCSLAFLLSSIV